MTDNRFTPISELDKIFFGEDDYFPAKEKDLFDLFEIELDNNQKDSETK